MDRAYSQLLLASAFAAALLAGCDRADRETLAAKTRQQSTTVAQAIDDGAITARVKTALLAADGVAGTSIDVDTTRGKVTLTGKLPAREQVDRAVRIAASVEGVSGVENRLVVAN
jgi:hyperosmotically inducible protein